MNRSWTPAALMGCLALGFLAGVVGRGSCGEGSRPAPAAPPASAVAPQPATPPAPAAHPPASQPPPAPIPTRARDDRLGDYPPWNGFDLDCSDLNGPVRVTGADPHRLDGNGDGIACEGR